MMGQVQCPFAGFFGYCVSLLKVDLQIGGGGEGEGTLRCWSKTRGLVVDAKFSSV